MTSTVYNLHVSTRRLILLLLILAVAGLIVTWAAVSRRAPGPLEVSLWYWHSPFQLTREESRELRRLGVRRIFVRAGTISVSLDGAAAIRPQTWRPSPSAPSAHLVFDFDSGAVGHFEELKNESIARCVILAYARARGAAKRARVKVLGLQIDFDCPTRQLPKYTDLLSRVRRSLPEGSVLSITSLPTWFTSSDIRDLVRQVDFYCPQFYETRIGRTLDDARPVSDLTVLRNGLRAAGKLGVPFYAGIPAYGHAFMFDDRGRLLGTYRAMSAVEAARHPSFRLARSWASDASGKPAADRAKWVGEEMADFVAVRPGANGKGLGYHLFYSLPTARMLSTNLRAVREDRPSNCLGVIIFRSPEPDEVMTLPMPALLGGVRESEARPFIRARARVDSAPWGMIEGGGSSSVATVSLTNTGDAASFFASDSVTLTLRFDAPGVEVESGDFDSIERFSASGLRASPARTSTLVFTCARIGVGQSVSTGPIRVTGGARSLRGEWRVRKPGGFGILKGQTDVIGLREGTVRP